LENSPDLLAARKAARYLGTVHREYVFTVQEGLDAIPEVIHHLETYDVTTVRASTPMYLLSRKIKAMGVKMVLSGEGSDEIFGGMISFVHSAGHIPDHFSLRLSLLPRCSRSCIISSRKRSSGKKSSYLRLPSRKQVHFNFIIIKDRNSET
jgi:asparagine synthetase B (glutamine-hydrolysing)